MEILNSGVVILVYTLLCLKISVMNNKGIS